LITGITTRNEHDDAQSSQSGELLREFMGDRSVTELAKHIGVARATLSRILNGRNAVSVDLSIRLGEALSLSPDFFAKAQLQYEPLAQVAEENAAPSSRLSQLLLPGEEQRSNRLRLHTKSHRHS